MGTGILYLFPAEPANGLLKRSFAGLFFVCQKILSVFLMQVVASGRIFLGLVEGDPFGILLKTKSR